MMRFGKSLKPLNLEVKYLSAVSSYNPKKFKEHLKKAKKLKD
jgi:hypothetical protein